MEHTLKNDQLTVLVDTFGAEMHSIQHEEIEYLWQADPKFWGRHAPVLFPIVGKLKNGKYHYAEKTYQMGGHGFARDNEFKVIKAEADELIFELRENEDSLNHYPFRFIFQVAYKLVGNKIKVRYMVQNKDEKFMNFGVGAHPAFNVPLKNGSFEDYKLTISPAEKRTFIPLDPPSGTIKVDEKFEVEVQELPLKHELFDKDALVYSSSDEMKVSLTNSLDNHGVTVTWKGMPYFGLWSPYPTEAPFVCIEPWCGIADDENTDGDLTTKFGINELAPEGKFSCEYFIEIN
ncbi:aldose 1-epimerase family protein [Lactococcus kimchii]|uniref:aldose 1-epimerase family protein n=1 Tax=Lactococcus sp. S-13 TaxID=2507158 RepID=UPI00102381C9|nr:aldose 1-epimerase family protein [Lactococcus sp. S-13]RZI49108.1 aldose 1-epimerase family protein [Lactococcus sp. S-13]